MNYSRIPFVLLNITSAVMCGYAAKLTQGKFLKASNKALCIANILLVGLNIYMMIAM